MPCNLAKPDTAEVPDDQFFIVLGRWRISLADLEVLQARLENSPCPDDVQKMAYKVVAAAVETVFYDQPDQPWLLLSAKERRALNGGNRP